LTKRATVRGLIESIRAASSKPTASGAIVALLVPAWGMATPRPIMVVLACMASPRFVGCAMAVYPSLDFHRLKPDCATDSHGE
jgi:hypothetical protein